MSMLLAAGPLTFSATGFAATTGSWFIGAQAGQSRLTGMTADKDTHARAALSGGYRWKINPSFDLGAEVGYVNLGSYGDSFYAGHIPMGGPTSGTVTAKIRGAFAGANARFNLGVRWHVTLQLGAFDARNHVDVTVADIPYMNSSTGYHRTSWYSGIGAGYRFAKHASVDLVLNHYNDTFDNRYNDRFNGYDLSSNLVSARLEMQF